MNFFYFFLTYFIFNKKPISIFVLMGKTKRKKHNFDLEWNTIFHFAKSRYELVQVLKEIIKSDFKLRNFQTPTHLLEDIMINFRTSISFVINFPLIYDVVRLLR
jgi:hypothetical protein